MAVVPVLARSCPLQGPVRPPLLALACLGRGRPGLGSVPPCPGAGSGSGPGLLPLAPGDLTGRLLELVHPLPGRRQERRADEHHARKPQQTTDPDQHPSPDQEAAVDLNAPLGRVIAHHLRPFRRSKDGRPEAAITSRHRRPSRNSPTIPARRRPPEVSSFSANRSFGKGDIPAAWARGLLNGPGLDPTLLPVTISMAMTRV